MNESTDPLDALREIRDLHKGEPVRTGGRKLKVSMWCRECAKNHPCATRAAADRALDAAGDQ